MRATRLQPLADAGDRRGASWLSEPSSISTIVSPVPNLGITLASLALGWIGRGPPWRRFSVYIFADLPAPFAALATHTMAGTSGVCPYLPFCILSLVSWAPKSLALLHPERISRWVAPPLLLFTDIFWPAIWLLNKGRGRVPHILFAVRPPAHAERVHDPEELLLLLSESRKHGLVEASNAEMIAGVFDLVHTSVRQAMTTPRTDMEAVERGWPLCRRRST